MKKSKKWTKREVNYLKKNYGKIQSIEIKEKYLPNKTIISIYRKARKLGLKSDLFMSERQRKNLSKIRKKWWKNPENKDKQKKAINLLNYYREKSNPMKNPIIAKKVSDKLRGIPKSYKHRKKLALSHIGMKASKITKEKMSKSHVKWYLNPKNEKKINKRNENISISNKGKKKPLFTEEHKKNIGLSSKKKWKNEKFRSRVVGKTWEEIFGEEIAEKLKLKLIKRMLGKENPMYKNGTSKFPYPLEWNNALKEEILCRDKKCVICNLSRKKCKNIYNWDLIVHHIDRDKTNLNPLNLISLCIFHHGKIQNFQDDLQDHFLAKNLNLI